ncbi:MAG: tetratricopeptide repeat protein [Nitrospinota bacterium]|jgi:hypothetical protein
MSKILALSLMGIFFLFSVCFDAYSMETKISDADATNIVLRNITKLDEVGGYPRFSPDGKQILFTKKITKKQGNKQLAILTIWIMDKDGKNKNVLLEEGYNGAWSPDGSKIAYCSPKSFLVGVSEDSLSIYDIKAKKKFALMPVTNCYMADVAWTKDGKRVFYDNHGWVMIKNSTFILDLDTLQTKDPSRYNDKERKEWKGTNLLTVAHPKVWIYEDKRYTTGGNLWIENRDNSFRKLLLSENSVVKKGSVTISPDLSKILFEIDRGGIYIANLDVIKDLPSRIFQVPIGRNIFLKKMTFFSDTGREEKFNRYINKGSIYGKVYEPKINPLNNKTIGPGKIEKGFVKFIKVFDDYAIVKVSEERFTRISSGDVVSYIHMNPAPGSGDGSDTITSVWGVLQSTEGGNNETRVDSLLKEAQQKMENKSYRDAITIYDRVLMLQSENMNRAEFHFNRGLAYDYIGELNRAIDDYNQTLSLDQNYVKAYNNRAVAYYKIGKYREAIEDCNKYLTFDKKWPEVYYIRALSKIELKDPKWNRRS